MKLFEIEFRETSQNFNSFSFFRQLLFSIFLSVVWLSWNLERLYDFFFSNRCWKFQLSILKNKTAIVIIKTKSFVYWPNFQWRFWCRCASHFFDQHSGCNIGCCSTGTTVKTTATTNSKPFDHYFEIQLIFCHLIAQKRVWVWNLNF